MVETKFRIETPNSAIEFAGSESFVESQLDKIEELLSMAGTQSRAQFGGAVAPSVDDDLSTNTIAAILGVNSGPELIIAAAAYLTLVKGEDRVTRSRLTEEMKAATSFFKATYLNNLSAYLERLTKADRLRIVAPPNTYALSARERQSIEAKLAQS